MWLYGFIMAASLIYIVNIVIVLGLYGLLPVMAGAALILIFVLSLTVCGYINYRYHTASFLTSAGLGSPQSRPRP